MLQLTNTILIRKTASAHVTTNIIILVLTPQIKGNCSATNLMQHSLPHNVNQGRFVHKFCRTRFYHATALVAHYKRKCQVYTLSEVNVYIHMLIYTEVEMKPFVNWIAFVSQKEEEDKSTYSSYVKPNGEVTSDNGQKTQVILIHNNIHAVVIRLSTIIILLLSSQLCIFVVYAYIGKS